MKYPTLPSDTLTSLLKDTRTYANDPYMLLTAYVISSIGELLDDEEEVWGARIPTEILNRYIDSCYMDFVNAAVEGDTIRINNTGFRVKKIKNLDINKAREMFDFPTDGDYSIIDENGILDVRKKVSQTHKEQSEAYNINRFYFWKVMMYAKGTDDQWNLLTDMEIAMFCWAVWVKNLPYSTIVNDDMVQEWWEREYEYFELPLDQIKSCLVTELVDDNKLNTYFAFDYYKVKAWNEDHNQKSTAERLSDMEAYDNWYNNLSTYFCRK